MTALLAMRGLNKAYGALQVTDNISLEVQTGELHAIIGPNGAGKTTLVSLLSGQIAPDAGDIFFDDCSITRLGMPQRARRGMARSFQLTAILPAFSVLENVAVAVQAVAGSSFILHGNVASEAALNDKARAILAEVGLERGLDRRADALSHGERRQLEFAMALATRPRLLLLDEPLAGTSAREADLLVALMAELKRKVTILLIEHDIGAVFSLADRISVLVSGRIIATGTPESVRANAEVRKAYLGEEA